MWGFPSTRERSPRCPAVGSRNNVPADEGRDRRTDTGGGYPRTHSVPSLGTGHYDTCSESEVSVEPGDPRASRGDTLGSPGIGPSPRLLPQESLRRRDRPPLSAPLSGTDPAQVGQEADGRVSSTSQGPPHTPLPVRLSRDPTRQGSSLTRFLRAADESDPGVRSSHSPTQPRKMSGGRQPRYSECSLPEKPATPHKSVVPSGGWSWKDSIGSGFPTHVICTGLDLNLKDRKDQPGDNVWSSTAVYGCVSGVRSLAHRGFYRETLVSTHKGQGEETEGKRTTESHGSLSTALDFTPVEMRRRGKRKTSRFAIYYSLRPLVSPTHLLLTNQITN